jgi:hypothetical protein
VILAVTIWYFGWANKTFKGPVRTIDMSEDEVHTAPSVA